MSGARNALRQDRSYEFPFNPLVLFKEPEETPSHAEGLELHWDSVDINVRGRPRALVFPRIYSIYGNVTNVHVRHTPSLLGLNLIEAIPDKDIEDWHQKHPEGILRIIPSSSDARVGRFGFKASQGILHDFVLNALEKELGVDGVRFLTATQLGELVFYSGEIGVPKRDSNSNPGATLFVRWSCVICHRPAYNIARTVGVKSFPMVIWPFSDFLLHDLGYPDQRTSFTQGTGDVAEAQWRTSALWGLGRVERVLGFGAYMHDGRARTLEEAILWHGGQAAYSREMYLNATPGDQDALLAFLKSL